MQHAICSDMHRRSHDLVVFRANPKVPALRDALVTRSGPEDRYERSPRDEASRHRTRQIMKTSSLRNWFQTVPGWHDEV